MPQGEKSPPSVATAFGYPGLASPFVLQLTKDISAFAGLRIKPIEHCAQTEKTVLLVDPEKRRRVHLSVRPSAYVLFRDSAFCEVAGDFPNRAQVAWYFGKDFLRPSS